MAIGGLARGGDDPLRSTAGYGATRHRQAEMRYHRRVVSPLALRRVSATDLVAAIAAVTTGDQRATDRSGTELLDFIERNLVLEVPAFWREVRGAYEKAKQGGDLSALAEALAGWEATAEIASNPAEAAALDQAIREFEAGDMEPWEAIESELAGE